VSLIQRKTFGHTKEINVLNATLRQTLRGNVGEEVTHNSRLTILYHPDGNNQLPQMPHRMFSSMEQTTHHGGGQLRSSNASALN